MARKPLRPLIRSGGFYPSRKWTPLVYAGGYTTANGGEEPAPPPIEKTVTGNPIHITDALAKPVQALSVKLEPIQDLHGYDNPWPAGGGHNIWDEVTELGGFDADGAENFRQDVLRSKNYIPCTQETSYYIKQGSLTDSAWSYFVFYDSSKNVVGERTTVYGTFTTPAGSAFMRFQCNTSYGATYNNNIAVNYPSTVTTYSPYSNLCPISGHTDADVIVSPTLNPADGTTYPIPLGQTVYGGTRDVLTGVLTVDRAMVDLGTLTWTYDQANTRFYASDFFPMPVQTENRKTPGVCSIFPVISDGRSAASVPNNALYFGYLQGISDKVIYVKTTDYTVAADFKTAMSGVQLVYPLATPQTIQLTAQQVELLLGENNIWSDGEMTLVYLADGNASDVEALNILLGGRYVNNHGEDEPTDREALNIILGGNER